MTRNSTFLRDISGIFLFHLYEPDDKQMRKFSHSILISGHKTWIFCTSKSNICLLEFKIADFHLQCLYFSLQIFIIYLSLSPEVYDTLCGRPKKHTEAFRGWFSVGVFLFGIFLLFFCFFITKYKCYIKANSKPLSINKYSLYIIYSPFLIQSNRTIHKSHWINLSVSI